uniref:Mitochondrial ribosomal protein L48 n=1 Tax=Haemonchus contortus TaxID=6289 RepID=A0A7I4YC74_HAECO
MWRYVSSLSVHAKGSRARRFPKKIPDRTTLDNDGYPNYRRRNLFPTEMQGISYTDEWVVPTNLYLLLKYDNHINLEICGMISAVKYLYKNIYKGPDRARISIENEPTVDDNQNIDEIKQHLNTRYVCAPQSMYRIFGYSMQDRSHAVFRLAVHLPELQDVQFVQGQEQEYLAQAQRTCTTLTAFL